MFYDLGVVFYVRVNNYIYIYVCITSSICRSENISQKTVCPSKDLLCLSCYSQICLVANTYLDLYIAKPCFPVCNMSIN